MYVCLYTMFLCPYALLELLSHNSYSTHISPTTKPLLKDSNSHIGFWPPAPTVSTLIDGHYYQFLFLAVKYVTRLWINIQQRFNRLMPKRYFCNKYYKQLTLTFFNPFVTKAHNCGCQYLLFWYFLYKLSQ